MGGNTVYDDQQKRAGKGREHSQVEGVRKEIQHFMQKQD